MASVRQAGRVPATRLSRQSRLGRPIRAVSHLAWRSLGAAVLMLTSQGCIVADPPEYREAVQTRPLLEVYKATPAINDIVTWSTTNPAVTFTIPVLSEDAGNNLRACAFTDYGVTGVARLVNAHPVPASTSAKSRDIVFSWRPEVSNGCHIFTIIVAHESSFSAGDSNELDPKTAGDDAAIVSWWAEINPDKSMPNTLTNCPQPALAPPTTP